MDVNTTNGLIVALAGLVISNAGMWYREYIKYKETKKGNGVIFEIKNNIKSVKNTVDSLKAGQIRTEEKLVGMKDVCADTRLTFSSAIGNNRKEILSIIKDKKD